jgi:hypothetical protein
MIAVKIPNMLAIDFFLDLEVPGVLKILSAFRDARQSQSRKISKSSEPSKLDFTKALVARSVRQTKNEIDSQSIFLLKTLSQVG